MHLGLYRSAQPHLSHPVPPPTKQESFYGCQLAALNGLAVEARCAIKARQVAALGPPVNLLVKVRAARKSCNEKKKNESKRGAAQGTQPGSRCGRPTAAAPGSLLR